MTEELPYHTEVISLLSDIADLHEIGPAELIALWFDTLYFPCQEYVSTIWQSKWRACFTQQELDALATFHNQFDSKLKGLTRDPQTWQRSEGWLAVSKAAREALSNIQSEA